VGRLRGASRGAAEPSKASVRGVDYLAPGSLALCSRQAARGFGVSNVAFGLAPSGEMGWLMSLAETRCSTDRTTSFESSCSFDLCPHFLRPLHQAHKAKRLLDWSEASLGRLESKSGQPAHLASEYRGLRAGPTITQETWLHARTSDDVVTG
jgi:hypothetical protein